MEYILSFLLLALNLTNYEFGINRYVFLIVGTVIFTALFVTVQKKTSDFLCSCLIMFCHTWQISWINIFGEPTAKLQLPWFYIIGVFIVIYAMTRFREIIGNKNNAFILLTFSVLSAISVVPLILSPSKTEGLKEFIMIGFFLVILFITFLLGGGIPREKRRLLADAFIWCVFISSVFIIIQTFAYHSLGVVLFKYEIASFWGHTLTGAQLLMEDTSCSSIMFGCAVFYILERLSSNRRLYVPALLTVVIAMAMTSRRTSVISLIIILAFYSLIHYKGIMKKAGMLLMFLGLTVVMISYLMLVRPVDSLSQYIFENGRIANYIRCIELFFQHPFGVGYDNVYLVSHMSNAVVPHNTVLRWLAMGGLWFVVPMLILLCYTAVTAYRKKLYPELWMIVYSLFASNFIPDILNARYFIIPCAAVLLFSGSAAEIEQDAPRLLDKKL